MSEIKKNTEIGNSESNTRIRGLFQLEDKNGNLVIDITEEDRVMMIYGLIADGINVFDVLQRLLRDNNGNDVLKWRANTDTDEAEVTSIVKHIFEWTIFKKKAVVNEYVIDSGTHIIVITNEGAPIQLPPWAENYGREIIMYKYDTQPVIASVGNIIGGQNANEGRCRYWAGPRENVWECSVEQI